MTDIHPKELLHKILRYAKGEGEYDPDTGNYPDLDDAWMEIESEIKQYTEQN